MPTETDLTQQLIEAQRSSSQTVDAVPYSTLDRDTALRIQIATMAGLGESAGLLKTLVMPDGIGTCAPIYRSRFGQTGAFQLPSTTITGLEVEVGLVLASDLTTDAANRDEIDIIEAIDHYFVGVEICGTRYVDRTVAGFVGGLADNASAFGYVMDPSHRDAGAEIANYDVHLEFAGQQLWNGPGKHSFGTVLNSFIAYAKNQRPEFPLKAGTIVTTGSLCGLVPISGPGHVVARLGNHTVEFDIV